jgi:hypothetical protein
MHIKQGTILLDHFRNGNYISWLQSRVDPFNMANIHSVLSVLKQKGHDIRREDRKAQRSGRRFSVYYLSAEGVTPELPEKFPEDQLPPDIPVASDRAVDYAATVLNPRKISAFNGDTGHANVAVANASADTELQADGELLERARTPEEDRERSVPVIEMMPELPLVAPAPEQEVALRLHHVANPNDSAQILTAFRKYCDAYGGKKVPITADWARLVLKLNRELADDAPGDLRRNRKIQRRKLEKFKKDFRENQFFYTNIGLGLDIHGMLCDGQTRLTASLETGLTFYADVSFDLPEETFAVVDSRLSSRSNADIGSMVGIREYPNVAVAAASVLYRKDHRLGITDRLDPRQLIQALHAYDVSESVAKSVHLGIPGPKSVFAAVHYLASKVNKEAADDMFLSLKTGAGLDSNDPVLVVRNRLLKSYASTANEFRGGPGEKRVRVLLSRAFNYRRKNIKLAKMLIDSGADDWPE